MEPQWSAHVWVVFLSLALGAGAGLLAYYGMHIAEARRTSKMFGRWLEDGRRLCYRVIDTEAAAADAKRELFEWIGELPKDFNPTLFLSCDLARGLQQTVLYEAEQQGLVRPGTFEMVFGLNPARMAQPSTGVQAAPPIAEPIADPITDIPPPSRQVPDNVHEIGALIALRQAR